MIDEEVKSLKKSKRIPKGQQDNPRIIEQLQSEARKNVEDRHAAPIFDSAAKMISAALQAKQGKLDKKLKMLELQMRKAKIDQDQEKIDISKGVDSDPEALEGRIVGDRTSMLEDIMKKINENDK